VEIARVTARKVCTTKLRKLINNIHIPQRELYSFSNWLRTNACGADSTPKLINNLNLFDEPRSQDGTKLSIAAVADAVMADKETETPPAKIQRTSIFGTLLASFTSRRAAGAAHVAHVSTTRAPASSSPRSPPAHDTTSTTPPPRESTSETLVPANGMRDEMANGNSALSLPHPTEFMHSMQRRDFAYSLAKAPENNKLVGTQTRAPLESRDEAFFKVTASQGFSIKRLCFRCKIENCAGHAHCIFDSNVFISNKYAPKSSHILPLHL
jgi:hypothetical protein